MQGKYWHFSVVGESRSLSHFLARTVSLSLSLSISLSLARSLSHTHTYACGHGIWWRMVECLQFGDVRHDTAVSPYPTIASFNVYRLPYTLIASLISDIGSLISNIG